LTWHPPQVGGKKGLEVKLGNEKAMDIRRASKNSKIKVPS